MQRIQKYIKTAACTIAIAAALPLTSCLEEAFPSSVVTQDQVDEGEKDRLVRAMPACMIVTGGSTYDIGYYPTIIMMREAMGQDEVPASPEYNYYSLFGQCTAIGSSSTIQFIYNQYYSALYKANLVLQACDPETYPEEGVYVANALVYRTLFNMELSEFYEYFPTGVEKLDAQAEATGIYGLTVPLQTETLTEAESRNNPRAPFQKMYRFILTDLNRAVEYLKPNPTAEDNTWASLGTAYGFMARLYLNLATRFERFPTDLTKMIESESDATLADLDKFGLNDANGYYAKAAEYARLAINQGYSPLSQSEWYDKSTGFNTPNHSWLFSVNYPSTCAIVTDGFWRSWPSYNSPEASYGISAAPYNSGRAIDVNLYNKINKNDWRRDTWINPDEAGDSLAYVNTYSKITSLDYKTWKNCAPYLSFKFRPGQGDGKTYTNGNAVSVPLMRVEEMYFIEAEATVHTQGVAAGKALLEDFMRTYRTTDGRYVSNSNSQTAMIDEIVLQKRIELWGEGQTLKDFNRLGYPIIRGYEGTNWYDNYRLNSYPNFRAPWTIVYIPNTEAMQNVGIIQNPNPSQAIQLWVQ